MFECPIDYFTDNLIFGRDKSCWALFEIVGFDYDMLSDESKISILNKLTLFLANVSQAKFMIIPVTQDLDITFTELENNFIKTDPLYEHAIYHANTTKNYLQDMVEVNGKGNDYKTFVAIKLIKNGEDEIIMLAKEALDFFVKAIINDFNAFMNRIYTP